MLENWCIWPFCGQPFWIAVRVMDMFLVEGPKFLYKLAFSAMKLFVATHKGKRLCSWLLALFAAADHTQILFWTMSRGTLC